MRGMWVGAFSLNVTTHFIFSHMEEGVSSEYSIERTKTRNSWTYPNNSHWVASLLAVCRAECCQEWLRCCSVRRGSSSATTRSPTPSSGTAVKFYSARRTHGRLLIFTDKRPNFTSTYRVYAPV